MLLPRLSALMRNALLIAALGLAQPAQAQTLTPAQMSVRGYAYFMGDGVAQSDSEAVRWYRAAAEAGDAWGMYNLGWMYDRGRGVARDPGLSADWVLQSGRGYANLVDDPTDLSPETLREIQQALQNAGLYTGALDGVFGAASLAALNAFDHR